MAMDSLSATFNVSNIKLVPIVSDQGILLFAPSPTAEHLEANGAKVSITYAPEKTPLTYSEAAAIYMKDRPDLKPHSARTAMIRACENSEIAHTGTGRATRINPASLDSWRLRKQKEYLDQSDRWSDKE